VTTARLARVKIIMDGLIRRLHNPGAISDPYRRCFMGVNDRNPYLEDAVELVIFSTVFLLGSFQVCPYGSTPYSQVRYGPATYVYLMGYN
jgi:hypothetical protein